ncbi:MAG TPA: 5'/3'-nucleotidase SurE [bacterium]|mgnify:CR=1 FL=1|nr:5'/3'-nucleotidase SurE [bacterium]HPN31056.1 5'/3'-nucleotidase SurE [bacterium]
MKILLTNDDGFLSKGIRVLFEHLKKIAEVIIVAPESQRSAVALSLSLHKPLRLHQIKKNVYISDGTPADCVNLGLFALMKNEAPDLIVSGINSGPNLAEDVFYSGTVGAVLEGRFRNICGLAVSMLADKNGDYNFNIGAEYAVKIIKKYFSTKQKKIISLNLNVPSLKKISDIKGIKITKLDNHKYPGEITERIDTSGQKYYWIGGSKPVFANSKDSDYNAVLNSFASLTPLLPEITDIELLRKLKNGGGIK